MDAKMVKCRTTVPIVTAMNPATMANTGLLPTKLSSAKPPAAPATPPMMTVRTMLVDMSCWYRDIQFSDLPNPPWRR
jgi:hypothetical protein